MNLQVWKLRFFSLLLFGILLIGCSSLSNSPKEGIKDYKTLALKIEASQSEIAPGESLKIRFTVTNKGQQPVIIENVEQPVMDIKIVAPPNNQTVWSWSKENPDQVGHRIEWQPGESKRIETVWIPRMEDSRFSKRSIGLGGFINESPSSPPSVVIPITEVNICIKPCL